MDKHLKGVDMPSEFVSLTAGGQGYCVDIHAIREIRSWTPVTTLPHSEPSVLGVMNLRGSVIPIIDLRRKLGLGQTPDAHRNVIVIATIHARTMGLLVEAVSEIISVPKSAILPNPTQRTDGEVSHIVGLISQDEKMLRVLDIQALISKETEVAA
ncbi:chemotaxis protein CheW [Donghicola mangrovi]|uniref:Purine-binding chemotaxis protein CheW n=1 Tax=Donghicola mangrovi TaxID=2729614 RepID=A0A850Q9H3_9RHOB|nr:chemotaxis protein CheW [Donghicola mangrovi]NVO23135.1 purine-binding chemotaxis protein CheW [Donghicola mangrovi]